MGTLSTKSIFAKEIERKIPIFSKMSSWSIDNYIWIIREAFFRKKSRFEYLVGRIIGDRYLGDC